MTDPRTHPGSLTISRTTSNVRPNVIRIRLIDETSGALVTEIELTPEDFALTVTGQAFVPCSHRTDLGCPVGKVREAKTEAVFVPDEPSGDAMLLAAREFIARLEFEGWKGRASDVMNHRNAIRGRPAPAGKRGRWFNVTFIRFVDPPGAPEGEGGK